MKELCIIILAILYGNSLIAQQELVSTTGGFFSNTAYQIEWSLGEPMIETYSNEEYILTQGFHQVYTNSDTVSNITILVYPNPTSKYLTVFLANIPCNRCKIEILSIKGEKIQSKPVNSSKEFFDLRGLPGGIYLLKITLDNGIFYIKKIIKI